MNPLVPIIGPGWSEPHQQLEENANEKHTRFDRAQGLQLTAWVKCELCGVVYKKSLGHECQAMQQAAVMEQMTKQILQLK